VSRSTVRSALLLSLAVPTAVTGAWAAGAPASWFRDFPGFGRHWLATYGPYDEHLARDFGGALLALAVLLIWTALAPGTPLRRVVPASFLIFALPHLAFHLAHAGELPAGDETVNLVLLTLSVAIPAALLLLPDHAPTRSHGAASGPDGWRLPPARPRGLVSRLSYAGSRRRFGHVVGPVAVTAHNPTVLAGYGAFELALERADSAERRLEELGALRAATMTGCPFCIDIGSALLGKLGASPEQLRELTNWRESKAFSEDERLVLEYAEAMTKIPVEVSDELFERLRARFDEAAIVELSAAIAFENYRGRFNHALGLGSEGFCQLPGNGRPAVEVVT
jgi:AhpD family alkylhydroperoxidase